MRNVRVKKGVSKYRLMSDEKRFIGMLEINLKSNVCSVAITEKGEIDALSIGVKST